MDQSAVFSVIKHMVENAEDYRDELSTDRRIAIRLYDNDPKIIPAEEGRSQVVSGDVRAAIKKVIPSLCRVILGGPEIVEYQPVGQDDEPGAEQASDYVNYVTLPECDGETAIHDAIHDACLLRNGILTWYVDEKVTVSRSEHAGLKADDLQELVAPDDVEVLSMDERIEVIQTDAGPIQLPLYDVEIKRRKRTRTIKLQAVPLDEFLVHDNTVDFEESALLGRKSRVTRSELVEMGHDRAKVDALPERQYDEGDNERAERRRDNVTGGGSDDVPHAMQEVDYYDLYVRIDMDDDGIAELRHMCFGGEISERYLLEDVEVEEAPYTSIKVESRPHQWEGMSVADDLCDVQRVKTVLLRQTLDNLYWQNDTQPIVQEGAVQNMEAVMEPAFGRAIKVRTGTSVGDAVSFRQVPFTAGESFGMLEYMDREGTERTGINDAAAGLPPDALQNVTAKASAIVEQASIGQVEEMVKEIAKGLKKAFRGILKLIKQNPDMKRTVRLRGEWVEVDPQHWNADMDATVNIGLGAGTRERDMIMMQLVIGIHERLLASIGADNPYVTPENLYNAIEQLLLAAGLKTPSQFVTRPDPDKVQQLMDQASDDPDARKLQAEMEFEKQKLELQFRLKQLELQQKLQIEQAKMAGNRDKERAQLEGDIAKSEAELRTDAALAQEELENDLIMQDREHEHQIELEALRSESDLTLEAMRQRFAAFSQPRERHDG